MFWWNCTLFCCRIRLCRESNSEAVKQLILIISSLPSQKSFIRVGVFFAKVF